MDKEDVNVLQLALFQSYGDRVVARQIISLLQSYGASFPVNSPKPFLLPLKLTDRKRGYNCNVIRIKSAFALFLLLLVFLILLHVYTHSRKSKSSPGYSSHQIYLVLNLMYIEMHFLRIQFG